VFFQKISNNIFMKEISYGQININLKKAIEWCGIPKSVIADRVGISRPTLSQYISGRAQPSLVTFAKLCNVIGASADEILWIEI